MNPWLDADRRGPAGASATRRVVFVGASNLTKGIGTVLETALGVWGRPLEVFAALGHGRSYGRTSSVLGRQLPGILRCGLWPELARLPALPTAALLTDIGNDLLYEEPVEQIVAWVEGCLDHLAAASARTVVTLLPIDNLRTLSRARFLLMRSLLVPRSRIGLEEISRRAHLLNDAVRRLALERGFALAAHRASWYGFDPVHIRPRHRRRAWGEILSHWSTPSEPMTAPRASIARTLYLRSRMPERRRVWCFEQRGRQPAAYLRDGTTVAIY